MAKKKWYAWRDAEGSGGIYRTWPECDAACKNRHGENHKGFLTFEEAWAFAYPNTPCPGADTWLDIQATQEPTSKPENALQVIESLPDQVMPIAEAVMDDLLPWEDTVVQGRSTSREGATEPPWEESASPRVRCASSVSVDADRFWEEFHFTHLSADQRRAVQAVNGKFLLFAVPGSGKTTVLMARAGYMVHVCGIPASDLMTMTFTRASAQEMRDRYRKYFPCDQGASIPDFRTIHSFCMGIALPKLRRAGFRFPRHVVDEDQNDEAAGQDEGHTDGVPQQKKKRQYAHYAILSDVLRRCGVADADDESVQEAAQTAFSGIKNREMPPEEYGRYSLRVKRETYPISRLFEAYQEELRRRDCMDYDDMLIYTLKGLTAHPQVLRDLQETYRYWSIDEAQDNSKVQNKLLNLLAGENGNLFMVGDDDQSIYSFRGAEPQLLLNYGTEPGVQKLIMGTNYRSDMNLVMTSKLFIEQNDHREKDKQMNASHTEPGILRIPPSFQSEAGQYRYIDQVARQCQQNGRKLGVLYQLNASALPLIVHMHHAGIPFEASKGLTELLNGKIVGGLIKILRFVNQPDSLSLFKEAQKAMGLFHRWTDDESDALREAHARQPRTPILQLLPDLMEDDRYNDIVEKCLQTVQTAQGKRPTEALTILLKGFRHLAPETLSERLCLYSLLSVCDLYETLPAMLDDLDAMKKKEQNRRREKDTAPDQQTDSEVFTGEESVVSLSTIHCAKGREWDHVILIDAFEEVFPGKPQYDRIGYDPEELLRLFYVAATRAIHTLDILTVESFHGNQEPVSPFISSFACGADEVFAEPVERMVDQSPEPSSTIYKLEPKKYYSVTFGPNPGVYTKWEDVEELKRKYRPSSQSQPKGHNTFEEAWEHVFPGRPVRETVQTSYRRIASVIQRSGGAVFNRALNLPVEVESGLLGYLGADSLNTLLPSQQARIARESDFNWAQSSTDYHGRTDGYAAAYMPVNFYKIWKPLWLLLSDGRLSYEARVLELGPGPGTSTWSMVEFYRWLAMENPGQHFALNYTAVERELDFSTLFRLLQERISVSLPANLSLTMELLPGLDAFDYMAGLAGNSFHLIVESNVMNQQETFNRRTIEAYVHGLHGGLRPDGYAILVEPKEPAGKSDFSSFIRYMHEKCRLGCFCDASVTAVDLSGIRLVQDAIRTGIRYSRKTKHWFSYAIMSKEIQEVTS